MDWQLFFINIVISCIIGYIIGTKIGVEQTKKELRIKQQIQENK